VVLVSDNHATKLAVKMACSLLRPRDELQLLTVVMSDSARAYGEKLLSQYTFDGDESNFCTPIVRGLLQPAARSLQHAACSTQPAACRRRSAWSLGAAGHGGPWASPCRGHDST
jgi:hypothetical protein